MSEAKPDDKEVEYLFEMVKERYGVLGSLKFLGKAVLGKQI